MRSTTIFLLCIAVIICLMSIISSVDVVQASEIPQGVPRGELHSQGGVGTRDKLGPKIVGVDGKPKRIPNWSELSKEEQDATWKRLDARKTEEFKRMQRETHEADRHDSTLNDVRATEKVQSADPVELEEKRREQLKLFLDSLESFKEATGGQDIPGFDAQAGLLNNPRTQDHGEVDFVELRKKLELIKARTEDLKRQQESGENHDEF